MSAEYEWSETQRELVELRRQEQVIAAMQNMFACRRRGLCLMHEWFRRYGQPGSGCACFAQFQEHFLASDIEGWSE